MTRRRISPFWINLALLMAAFAMANSANASKFAHNPAVAHEVQMGAYVTSLYDLNSNNGTFGADLWIWSKAHKRTAFKLQMLEVTALSSKFAHTYFGDNSYSLDRGIVYSVRKLHGSFLHDYDIRNFPFDRQVLKIHIENSEENARVVRFVTDAQSGYDQDISIDGWKIDSFRTVATTKGYRSNFGYTPDDPSVVYPRVTLEIGLKRDAPLIFFKVTLGLFAAMTLAILSSLLPAKNDDLFSARVGLLGGSLLAIVVNQQFADAKSGEAAAVTLIDFLHMLGSVGVLALFIATGFSRYLAMQVAPRFRAKGFDRFMVIGVTIAFYSFASVWTLGAMSSS